MTYQLDTELTTAVEHMATRYQYLRESGVTLQGLHIQRRFHLEDIKTMVIREGYSDVMPYILLYRRLVRA